MWVQNGGEMGYNGRNREISMKAFHFLLGLVLYMAVAAAGLALLAGVHCAEGVERCLGWLMRTTDPTGFWLGVGTLCYLFLFLLTGLPRRARKSFVTFANEDGTVSVSTAALQEYVDRLKGEFAAVAWMKTALGVRRGALAVGLVLGVKESTRIPELCRLVQARVREVLEEHLGTCDLAGISVEVAEIRARKAAADGAEPA